MKTLLLATLAFSALTAFADEREIRYPRVYPFVAENTSVIYQDVKRVTEDPNFIRNFNTMVQRGLIEKKTTMKPWSASYWPLAKGTIGDNFTEDFLSYWVDFNWVIWENNYKGFKKRFKEKLSQIDQMTDEELAKLAPSEKYDLLLGDKSFNLTQRLWEYMYMWGSKKEIAFLKENGIKLVGDDSLDLAEDYVAKNWYPSVDDAFKNNDVLKPTLAAEKALELVAEGKYPDAASAFGEALDWAKAEEPNYVLEKKSGLLAVWEGICNGWSTAAGLVPRPRRAISFRLPNGRNLKFFPEDIKGIVSLYYVNSVIQDPASLGNDGMPTNQGTVSVGLRCNLKSPKKDIWGRFYDSEIDPNSTTGKREARCSGVHPAAWHLGLVNLIGKQDRSFIVERKVGAAVDNHPMYGYKMKFFNPNTGKNEKDLNKNIERIDEQDQFRQFRSKTAVYVVGVENTVIYMNYLNPKRKETNSEKDDKEVDHKMMYDLELDADMNIVGGQWRATKVGQAGENDNSLNHNQPNFFWTITRDYKKTGWFDDNKTISAWTNKRVPPPADWQGLAKSPAYHANMYENTVAYRNADNCRMKNKKTGKSRTVFCELETNRPLPLINVVNALVELSK